MQQAKRNDQNHGSTDNEAVLNEVVRNTEMGKNTTGQLISVTRDRQLKASLLSQQRQFRQLNQQAHTALAALGARGHGQSRMAKMAAEMGIAAKTMADPSPRNLADMVIQGASRAVTDCEKARRDHPHASTGAMRLLDELQSFEESITREMRAFL